MARHFSGFSASDGARAELIRQALLDRAEDIFTLAWGKPVKARGADWRASSGSSRSMAMQGPKRGQWFDHSAGTGGDLLDLVAAELCGLSSARDDFPRVLDEAARFCGLVQGKLPDLSALMANKAAREAEGARQEAAQALSRARLVETLQARVKPLEGSPAASYLAARGIDALPGGWGYLPPVPGLSVMHPHRPALVAWAVDASGQVTGGQRILICEDGSKAPEDTRKPAFGAIGGSPARIPARVAGGPLCIAEGPETAAAIAQATGFEAWAVFGASGFASAPARLDVKVILCPDRDAPGSPAAKAFEAACGKLARRGVDLWIAPAPEPEGSKRDMADTLQGQGPEAVEAAVAAAARFALKDNKGRFTGEGAFDAEPLQMPDFVSPDEASERTKAEMRGFLAEAAAWCAAKDAWAAYCEKNNSGPIPPELEGAAEIARAPAPVLAIATSPGAGKSRFAREMLAETDLSLFGGGDTMFTTPTLQLADEAAKHAIELGGGGHVTRGRSAGKPSPMCARADMAERVAKAGLMVKPTLCEQKQKDGPPKLCPYHTSCKYLQQWKGLEDAPVQRFEANAYLSLPGDGSGRKTGLRIIDESIWQQFTRTSDLPLDRWQRPRNLAVRTAKRGARPTSADYDKAAGMGADMTTAAQDILSAMQRGLSPLSLPYTAEDYRAYAEAERGPSVLSVDPSASDEALDRALTAFEKHDPDAGKRAAIWSILADCAERGLQATERLRLVRDVPSPGTGEKRDVLRAAWFAEPPRDVPVLLLDADATPEIVERLYPGAGLVRMELRPNAEVVQVHDRTFSKAALQRPRVRAEVVSLVRAEARRDKFSGARGVLAIASKSVVRQLFEDAGHDFRNVGEKQISEMMQSTTLHGARWLWFGPASLGRNDWKDFGTAVVIGREELPLDALQDLGRALFGDTAEPLALISEADGSNLPEATLPYLMADGSGAAVKARAHPDRRVRELQQQRREMATRQGFERLRLGTAINRKRLVIASKVPVPGLPVDRLVTWQELAPDRLEAAMAEAALRGGVLRVSAAGLAQDAPETFGSEQRARDWLKAEGKARVLGGAPLIRYTISGNPPINPVRVRLRLEGQRGARPTPALVVLPGNSRALAEAQLGPLSAFELVQDDVPPGLIPITTREPPAPERRLIILPAAQQIASPLMARFLARRSSHAARGRNFPHIKEADNMPRDIARLLPHVYPKIRVDNGGVKGGQFELARGGKAF